MGNNYVFNYKGITSYIAFCSTTIKYLPRIIDSIYNYFNINDIFPEFKIILHLNYKNNSNTAPQVRNGLIIGTQE